MTQTTPIGLGTETLHLEIADAVLVETTPAAETTAAATDSPAPQHPSLDPQAIADRVTGALLHPEQFLSVTEMVVPGDCMAIALEDGLPTPEAIVAGVLQAIADCQLAKVEVVVSPSFGDAALARLRFSLPETVEVTVHNLSDRAAVGYLGADEDAEPIRVNRSLVDADFVLPISVMRVSDPLLGGPSGDALYPGLVDQAQRKRLQRLTARAISRRQNYHDSWAASQAHQVRWTLGVQLMVAVEVTTGGQIGRVIASSPETLRQNVEMHYACCRRGGRAESADVVVASVEGDDDQQRIENLLRAALVARSFAAPSATVVLVTTLGQLVAAHGVGDPYEDDENLSGADRPDDESAQLLGSESPAGFAGSLLRDLINDIDPGRRYLLWFSGNWEAAEAFGFGVVQDQASLVHLINQHSSLCVLRAAQTAADATVAHTRRS
jgi:hypothetical protein